MNMLSFKFRSRAIALISFLLIGLSLFAQTTITPTKVLIGLRADEKNMESLIFGGNGDYVIEGDGANGGIVTAFSGTSIILKPGFHAQKGSSFTAKVGELVVPDIGNSPNFNWVSSKVYDGDGVVIADSKSFADYLGRAVQSQTRNISAKKVIVSQTLYDNLGRAVLTTMPVPISQTKLDYKNGLICNSMGRNYSVEDFDSETTLNDPRAVNSSIPNTLGWYYSDNNTDESHVATTKYPYARVDYSKTLSGKAKRSAGAGEAYRMGSGREMVSFTMLAADNEFKDIIIPNESIENSKLIKSISQDAEGRQVVSYSSDGKAIASCLSGVNDTGSGNTIPIPVRHSVQAETGYLDIHIPQGNSSITLSSGTYDIVDLVTDNLIKNNASLNGAFTFSSAQLNSSRFYRIRSKSGAFTLDQTLNYYHHSFNVYDEAGRLTKSYSPKAVADKDATNCTTYKYNSLGWLLESDSPEQGKSELRYRKDGQIRFSRNELQLSKNKFSYTNYDNQGRPIESGVFTYTTDIFASIDVNDYIPSKSNCKDTICTLYDIADSDLSDEAGYGDLDGFPQEYLLGKVSKTWNDNSTTWYSYTYDGNVAWVVQKINDIPDHLFCVYYDYNFNGNVTRVEYEPGKDTQFIHTYTYDADNRLSEVKTKGPSDASFKTQATYHYYEHGPLKRVELADNLQGIDYVYTLQGALKSINHPNLDGNDPGKDGFSGTHSAFKKDVFALGLDYYSGDYTRSGTAISAGQGANYAGNINTMRWKTRDLVNDNAGSTQNMYQFAYFNNNWLKQGVFGSFNQGSKSFTAKQDYKVDNLTYDANGNIKTLNRNAYGSNLAMDKLTYHYPTGSNKLSSVSDTDGDAGMNDMASQGSNNYTYDAIGQMTGNAQDGHYFDYDVSGKVKAVYANAAKTDSIAQYKYDDRGFRVKKEDLRQNETTYYIRDLSGKIMAIYSDRDDKNLDTPEEYALYGSGRLGLARVEPGKLSYIYELADHLGNVRATIKKEDDGSLGLISQADYYPFGMLMPGRITGANEYRYGYQGQFAEKDEETGYNQFEARLYDSRLGRWLTTDPAGQFYSPYLGMGNNCPNVIDMDGEVAWFVPGIIGGVVAIGFNVIAQINDGTFDLSSGKTWARMGVSGTAGFGLAYVPGGWTGITTVGLASGTANVFDQAIKNDGFNNIDKIEVVSNTLGGVAGFKIGGMWANNIKPGTGIGSTLIHNFGVDFRKKVIKDAMRNTTEAVGGIWGGYSATWAYDLMNYNSTSILEISNLGTHRVNGMVRDGVLLNEVVVNPK